MAPQEAESEFTSAGLNWLCTDETGFLYLVVLRQNSTDSSKNYLLKFEKRYSKLDVTDLVGPNTLWPIFGATSLHRFLTHLVVVPR